MRHSLSVRVLRTTLMSAVIMGGIALLVGLCLYTYALIGQYIVDSSGMSGSAAMAVRRSGDPVKIANEVMEIYRSLPQEEYGQTGTPEYRKRFSHIEEYTDYRTLWEVLDGFLKNSDLYDIYLAMYDRETCAIVYMVDPAVENTMCPGDWESVTEIEMLKFLDWDGTGRLYDLGWTDQYGWMCTSGVPIRDENGETVAFVLADITLDNLVDKIGRFTLQFTLALLLVTALIGFFAVRRMRRTTVHPINAIAAAAESYVKDKRANVEHTEHFAALNIRTGDEIENLSLVMADMERDLVEYEKELTESISEKERIGTELALAAGIQNHMLPNMFPAFPDQEEFEIYATMEPAKEVGGDFYDFFMIDDDHLAMVVADVSGKGVPAALFMMISKTILKNEAAHDRSPAEVLSSVNEQLSENNDEDMFVTAWLGVLELSTLQLTYADAGHEDPLLYHGGEWRYLEKMRRSPALAMLSPWLLKTRKKPPFVDIKLQLEPGDVLFQYTDGVTEATDGQDELFGEERLLEAVGRAPSLAPEKLLPYIREEIDGFVKEAPQFDDITMLAVRIKKSGIST